MEFPTIVRNIAALACGFCLIASGACPVAGAPPATTAIEVAVLEAATQPVSNTRYALREIRIPTVGFAPSTSAVETFINQRATDLAKDLLGRSGENMEDWFRTGTSIGTGNIVHTLVVNLPREEVEPKGRTPAKAKEFLDAVVSSLQKFVDDDFARQRDEQLQPLQAARNESAAQLDAAEREAAELRARMRKLAGRGDISGKTITEAMTRLEEEKQKLELDMMAKTARREALEEGIAEQSKRAQEKVTDDPIAAELEAGVKIREVQLDRLKKMFQSGTASNEEMQEAAAKLAEARAKVLVRKRDAAAEAGGESLAVLNRELMTLAIDLRELKVRLEFVQSHLPGLRDAMDQLDPWERAEANVQSAREDLSKATSELRRTSRSFAVARPPQVSVAKSENRAQRPAEIPLFPIEGGLFGGSTDPAAASQPAPRY
jgi:hypothetical protein